MSHAWHLFFKINEKLTPGIVKDLLAFLSQKGYIYVNTPGYLSVDSKEPISSSFERVLEECGKGKANAFDFKYKNIFFTLWANYQPEEKIHISFSYYSEDIDKLEQIKKEFEELKKIISQRLDMKEITVDDENRGRIVS